MFGSRRVARRSSRRTVRRGRRRRCPPDEGSGWKEGSGPVMPLLVVALVDLAIAAALVGAAWIWNRLRFARDRSSFPCRLAPVGERAASRVCPHWLHLKTRAKWQDDVLSIQAGLLYAQT